MAIAALATILVVVFGLFYCAEPRRPDPNKIVASGAARELQSIYVALMSELRSGVSNAPPESVQRAVEGMSARLKPMGADFFKLQSGSEHISVCLNPDPAIWSQPTSYSNDIVAFWPVRFAFGTNQGFMAIAADGSIIQLHRLPTWTPVKAR